MMEASASTGKASPPPMLSPRSAANATKANATSTSTTSTTGATAAAVPAAGSSLPGLAGKSFKVPAMPKVIADKTDDLTNRIVATDIARINGYMRFANLVSAILLGATCFIRMFMVSSYSDFLVVIYIMFMAATLVFIENHNQFPSIAEKVKTNFGFMFTATGKAGFILCIAFLAFSQGWIGTLLGLFLLIVALFNFFLIKRHPAYQAHMTNTQTTTSQQQADLEAMPELRYNQSQQPTAQTAHVVV